MQQIFLRSVPLFLERLCEIFRKTTQMIHRLNWFPKKNESTREELGWLAGLAQFPIVIKDGFIGGMQDGAHPS
jgi:hypothetical protein